MPKIFFDHAYGLDDQAQVDAFYDEWADSYDAEVLDYGYASPRRCAQALAQFAPLNVPVLDFGCGTGLSGMALRDAGFHVIDGVDINENMLLQAKKRSVYRKVYKSNPIQPFDFSNETYGAIIAVGVISHGAGSAGLLAQAVHTLPKNGVLCFSYNDHTVQDVAYTDALQSVLDQGFAVKEYEEWGDHLPTKSVKSMVYVLRRR